MGRALGWNTVRSDRWEVAESGGRLIFEGAGEGHGVGMCQRGADQMGAKATGIARFSRSIFPAPRSGIRRARTRVAAHVRRERRAHDDAARSRSRGAGERGAAGEGDPAAVRLARAGQDRDPRLPGRGDLPQRHRRAGMGGRAHHRQRASSCSPPRRAMRRSATNCCTCSWKRRPARDTAGVVPRRARRVPRASRERPASEVAEDDLRQTPDESRARQAYGASTQKVAELVQRYGVPTVLAFLKTGLPK